MKSIRNPSRYGISLWLLLLAACSFADSTPVFWKVTSTYDDKAVLYVLGSIHMGRADFYPLPKAIDTAFGQSQVLAVEVDISALDPLQAARTLSQYALLPEGQLLKDQLTPVLWGSLQKSAAQQGLPLQNLERMRPWFVAMQLELALFQQRGFSELYGVDLYFLKQKQNKRVVAIETLEEQLGLFQELNAAEQRYFLETTLQSFEQADSYVKEFSRVWQEGDTGGMDKLIAENIDVKDPAGERIHDLLFVRRNQKMLEAAEKLLRSGQTAFMVVGAAHLLGEEGVIAGLQAREHRVERVLFTPQK